MLDGYHILTITHRDAPLENIGRAVMLTDTAAKLNALKTHFGWEELYYVATCNRVFYLFYSNNPVSEQLPQALLQTIRPDLSELLIAQVASQMRLMTGTEAIRHLFEVASSMDSLVVGEREILRQLREAHDFCREADLLGDHLRLLLRFTTETAKEVYSNTGIGEKALSVVALAFAAFQQKRLPLDARILMVGAGQTNALFAKFLVKAGYRQVTVFNRTLERAENLAASANWRALPLDALPYYTEGFDALVVCTGATQAVITPDLYQHLLQGDTAAKIAVDLSIPYNIDKAVVSRFPVHLIEVESLREAARENLAFRERECLKAGVIIQRRIQAYRALWHERQVERSLAHIPAEVKAVKERAVREVFSREFEAFDAETRETVLRMLEYMEKKCVAIPIKAAKAVALQHRQLSTANPAPSQAPAALAE